MRPTQENRPLFPCRSPALGHVVDGALRMAPLLGLPRFLADHGLDPDTEIRANGCDPALFRDPESTIDFPAAGALLVHAARVTGHPYTGLELGRNLGLDVLGAVAGVLRAAPDLRTALRVLILYFHLRDRGAIAFLWEGGERAMFGYTLYCPGVPGTNHFYDGAMAIARNIIAELAGPEWRPTEVRLVRERPGDVSPFYRHFRTALRFGVEQAAIVFPAADLERPLASADEGVYGRALRRLQELDAEATGRLADKVRRILRGLFVTGSDPDAIDLQHVARLLVLHPRTLNRRLQGEGTTFRALLAQTRFEIARQLLRDTRRPVGDIALALGYADAASFTHAFRRWSGSNAGAWRSSNEQE